MLALLGGLLAIAVGNSLLFFPIAGIVSLTLLIGAFFLEVTSGLGGAGTFEVPVMPIRIPGKPWSVPQY